MIGRGSSVEFGVQIGSRVLIQSDVYVTAGVVVEDDVFIGPGVVMTNDDTMGRHPDGEPLRGPCCAAPAASAVAPSWSRAWRSVRRRSSLPAPS